MDGINQAVSFLLSDILNIDGWYRIVGKKTYLDRAAFGFFQMPLVVIMSIPNFAFYSVVRDDYLSVYIFITVSTTLRLLK
jgi:hypothetical protein